MILLRALVPIARDLAGTFVFVALFFLTDIYIATGCGISLVVAQTVWSLVRKKPIGALQWLSLVLISMFGGATILFHWPYFIMVKPSILWLALGVVMLRRDWMAPYLPAIVTENLDDRLIVRAGYAYAALMFALAIVNLIVVGLAVVEIVSQKFWAVYALVGPTAAQGVLLVMFYFRFRKRILVRIRQRKAAAAEPAS
jgi:intracellular septation protein A